MHHQRETVQSTPDHKCPGAAVPETTEQHRDHDVAINEPGRPAISAERNVKIIAEPARETDVPAMPEVGNARREIRETKIDGQLVTEEARGSDGHVGVTGKIAIDLDRVEQHRDPRARCREIPRRVEVAIDEW